MAQKVRVEFDVRAFDLMRREAAQGLLAVVEEALARADVPDASPYGQGLIQKGAAVAFIDGDRVGGEADLPRGESADGIVAYVGWPFPARFQEQGTIRQPARPFVTPAVQSATSDGLAIIARTTRMGR